MSRDHDRDVDVERAADEEHEGGGAGEFLRGVRAEFDRISWMSPRELLMSLGVVTVAVGGVVAMLWAYDTVLSRLLRLILR